MNSFGKYAVAGLIGALSAGSAWSQTAMAKTPPMGWNSWNHFGCNDGGGITETLFKQMADAMVTSGMAAAGYKFVNVDDCWHGSRLPSGYITASASFTNNSMDSLSNYIHRKGLKFGIYTCAGAATCANRPGSLGFENKDIEQYAKWGVDYVKVDWCSITADQNNNPLATYKVFSTAIQANAAIHPMILSICNWGQKQPWFWGRSAGGNLWRTTLDIKLGWDSFTGIIDQEVQLFSYAGPGATAAAAGGWNDPDMLEVGRGMSQDEDKSHFGMWCMLAAPLIAGNDLRTMTNATKDILTNKDVIAVDQDSLGYQAQRVSVPTPNLEVWAKPLTGNARAVALFNRTTSAANITFNWTDLDKWNAKSPWPADKQVTVLDLWSHTELGTAKSGSFTVNNIPSHGIAMLKLYDPNGISIRKLNLGDKSWVNLSSDMVKVNYAGDYTIRVQDLRGRVLWTQSANGVHTFALDHLGVIGTRIIRIKSAEGAVSARF